MDLSNYPVHVSAAYMRAVANAGPYPVLAGAAADSGAPHTLSGLVPSDDDVRDYPLVWSGRPVLAEIDYRPECSPIRNQGQVGACTAFHADSHCGRYAKRGGAAESLQVFSPRANYAMSRQLMGLTGDSGASLRAAIHAAYKYGMPYEQEYPYGTDWQAIINTTTLPDAVMAAAAKNKIDSYYRIVPDLKDETLITRRIDRALADGYTVGIGIFLHYWFYRIKGPLSTHAALRKNPPPGATTWGSIIGAHAMVIVGRSDALAGYIVRNQWDTTWGDAGYYLMPFEDVHEAFEFWAVAGFDGSDVVPAPYNVDCAEAQAARLYRTALARYPDAGGLAFWRDQIEAGRCTLRDAANAFMASPEYARLYGSAPSSLAFATALYRNALRREPDPGGLNYWVGALDKGVPRADVLLAFSESAELEAAA